MAEREPREEDDETEFNEDLEEEINEPDDFSGATEGDR
jgi:hypothetical protein